MNEISNYRDLLSLAVTRTNHGKGREVVFDSIATTSSFTGPNRSCRQEWSSDKLIVMDAC